MSAVVSTSNSHQDGRGKSGKHIVAPSSSKPSAKIVPLNEKLLLTTGNSITSICFDDRGDRLLTCGDDEKIQLFSLSSGRLASTNYSKKYGVDLVRFTHDINNMVHASTKVDHAIRYHSLAENKYLSYFRGHTNRVSSLDMSPTSANAFMSAAVYESVRLWDLRSASSQACMVVQGHPIIRYDPTGTIFALAFNETNKVLLYDARKWAEKPFKQMEIPDLFKNEVGGQVAVITSLHFSPSGSQLLVGTSGPAHYILDAQKGYVVHNLTGKKTLQKASPGNDAEEAGEVPSTSKQKESPMVKEAGISGTECGWTPDGKYVFSVSGNKDVVFWSVTEKEEGARIVSELTPTFSLDAYPGGFIRSAAFNPRNAMMATGGDQVALWLPEREEKEE
ncbi:WD40 repeat-like protein [Meira miltonrushii]|uniref:WD40 repeat-like protein n=1 Tax=Meira miltonrushii TaxID=1280837 RepID=A0A316V9C3_9BASI|nr:WD40 repeat-like protein [Meira miltonrushii]PWN34052.1 WD40 repeat-like protein [Meira miltonrushii]